MRPAAFAARPPISAPTPTRSCGRLALRLPTSRACASGASFRPSPPVPRSRPSPGPAIGVAAPSLESDAEMVGERTNGLGLLGVGVAVGGADDDRREADPLAPAGRKHRRRQRISLAVAQRQEHRHLALKMRLEPDLPLEANLRARPIGLRRLFRLLAEVFLDLVVHEFRFDDGLGLGLEAEPGLSPWRIADVPHFSP